MKETQATRQIHSLSDEEVSRWIAEKLWPGGPKEWQLDAPFLKSNPWQLIDGRWQPRDFVNDAQMTVMLLEKLHAEDTVVIQLDGGRTGMSIDGLPGGIRYFVSGESFGRAIAEAFMFANGYKEC